MNDVTAAGRYTRALFELAEKNNQLRETDASLHALARILETEPKILRLLENPTLTTAQKYDLAIKTLAGGQPGLLERFLRVLIDTKRFALLPEIQKDFHNAFEKKQGVQEVVVISAVPFSSAFLEKLKTVLTKRLRSAPGANEPEARKEIRLIPRTDRDLLGGFVLRFAGKEIDCSFKNRLHEIQQKLFSSVQEGIA
jgi:F-type H+-transporting ATPase subunit delta